MSGNSRIFSRLWTPPAPVNEPPAPIFTASGTPLDAIAGGFRRVKLDRVVSGEPLPRPTWVLPGLEPGGLGILAGEGGVGKGWIALSAVAAVSLGMPVCPGAGQRGKACEAGLWPAPPQKERAVYLSGEDSAEAIERRVAALDGWAAANGWNKPDLYGERYSLASWLESRDAWLIGAVGQLQPIVDDRGRPTKLAGRIRELAKDASLMIIDTFRLISPGDENDSGLMTAALAILADIAQESGAAIVCTHHTNKVGSRGYVDQHSLRGSSAIVNNVRWCAVARLMVPDEGRAYGVIESEASTYEQLAPSDRLALSRYVAVEIVKANELPREQRMGWLERVDGGVLQHVHLDLRERSGGGEVVPFKERSGKKGGGRSW